MISKYVVKRDAGKDSEIKLRNDDEFTSNEEYQKSIKEDIVKAFDKNQCSEKEFKNVLQASILNAVNNMEKKI